MLTTASRVSAQIEGEFRCAYAAFADASVEALLTITENAS